MKLTEAWTTNQVTIFFFPCQSPVRTRKQKPTAQIWNPVQRWIKVSSQNKTSKESISSFWLTKNSAPSQYKHKLLKLWKCAIVEYFIMLSLNSRWHSFRCWSWGSFASVRMCRTASRGRQTIRKSENVLQYWYVNQRFWSERWVSQRELQTVSGEAQWIEAKDFFTLVISLVIKRRTHETE